MLSSVPLPAVTGSSDSVEDKIPAFKKTLEDIFLNKEDFVNKLITLITQLIKTYERTQSQSLRHEILGLFIRAQHELTSAFTTNTQRLLKRETTTDEAKAKKIKDMKVFCKSVSGIAKGIYFYYDFCSESEMKPAVFRLFFNLNNIITNFSKNIIALLEESNAAEKSILVMKFKNYKYQIQGVDLYPVSYDQIIIAIEFRDEFQAIISDICSRYKRLNPVEGHIFMEIQNIHDHYAFKLRDSIMTAWNNLPGKNWALFNYLTTKHQAFKKTETGASYFSVESIQEFSHLWNGDLEELSQLGYTDDQLSRLVRAPEFISTHQFIRRQLSPLTLSPLSSATTPSTPPSKQKRKYESYEPQPLQNDTEDQQKDSFEDRSSSSVDYRLTRRRCVVNLFKQDVSDIFRSDSRFYNRSDSTSSSNTVQPAHYPDEFENVKTPPQSSENDSSELEYGVEDNYFPR